MLQSGFGQMIVFGWIIWIVIVVLVLWFAWRVVRALEKIADKVGR